MAMQDVRNQRAYAAMRDALSWIAGGKPPCGVWDPEDFEQFAREAITRARDALETERNAATTRRQPRHSL
jgi:hypothetical protein